jgi:hypothetical protein
LRAAYLILGAIHGRGGLGQVVGEGVAGQVGIDPCEAWVPSHVLAGLERVLVVERERLLRKLERRVLRLLPRAPPLLRTVYPPRIM